MAKFYLRPGMLVRGYRRVKTAIKKPKRYLGIGQRRKVATGMSGLVAGWNKEAIYRKRRIGVGLGAAGVVGAGAYGVRKRRQRRK